MKGQAIKIGCRDRQTAEEIMDNVANTGFFAAEPEPIFTKRAIRRKSRQMESVNLVIDMLNNVEEPEASVAYAQLEQNLDKIVRESGGKVKFL